MRVLVTIPGLTRDGGAERSAAEMILELQNRGVDVHLCATDGRNDYRRELDAAGVIVHPAAIRHSFGARLRAIDGVVQSIKPDLIHASLFDAALASQLVGRFRSTPVLVTWASTSYSKGRRVESGLPAWKVYSIQAIDLVVSHLTRTTFHAVTRGVADSNGHHLRIPPQRIKVGERGRRPEQCEPQDEVAHLSSFDIPDSARVVLAIGRHEPAKGYPQLLCGLSGLLRENSQLVLVIAGREGLDTRSMQRVIKQQGVSRQVVLLGQVDDIPSLLRRSEVVVNGSLREGAAGALIEAMACGKAIVAPPLEGLQGMFRNGVDALIVPRAEISNSVRRLLNDEDLRRDLGANARAAFMNRFTLDVSVSRMVQIYAETVAGVEGA